MALYELVREIQNECSRNQMRDVFFDEIETDDPVEYVRGLITDENKELTVEQGRDGNITVFACASGLHQKFVFTEI